MEISRPRAVAIVEDDVMMAMFLEEVCRMAGCDHVGTASSMEGGLDILAEQNPACMILDYKLDGDATGLDLIVRAKEQHPHLFTILITAWDINHIATLIGGDRPDRILRKPVMARTLVDVLGAVPGWAGRED